MWLPRALETRTAGTPGEGLQVPDAVFITLALISGISLNTAVSTDFFLLLRKLLVTLFLHMF